jgi:ABC-type transport system substrate-binding protein
MYKKALMAIVILAMVSMTIAPAFAWEHPDEDIASTSPLKSPIKNLTCSNLVSSSTYTGAYLTFGIREQGKDGMLYLTLTGPGPYSRFCAGRWPARSGDNIPINEDQEDVGPIPDGRWLVHEHGYNPNHHEWYYLERAPETNNHGRGGFYIHPYGSIFEGCIAVHDFPDLVQTLNKYPIVQQRLATNKLNLIVRYLKSAHESHGPRADSLLIKLYASETSEWETGLEGGEIDITDWPLDHTHLVKYTTPPWNAELNVYGYGAEFGAYLFDLNNNNNTELAPGYPNQRYPNPMGYTEAQSGIIHDGGYPLRHAIAHLVNRDAVVSYVGTEAAVPIYTPTPACYGKYQHPDIVPGGSREDLTHPYDPAVATTILNDAVMFPIGTDGWRYWDRNHNHVYDGGTEYLELKLIARVDHAARDYMGTLLGNELVAQHIHVNVQHITITAARIQWMTNKDAHIYTAGWSLGTTPDSLVLWHWGYYWHPGNSYNTGGCNKDAFNNAADGVQYANSQDDAVYNARVAQEVFCDAVLGVAVYSASGYKAMSKTYVGNGAAPGEEEYEGEDWCDVVNWLGYGIDNSWTFMNMHTSCHEYGGRIRYGFKTQDLRQLNPIYTEWLWDNTVLGLIGYESLVAVDPYTLAYIPWVAKQYSVGTYTHPTYGTCSKVVFTLRNDVYFQDGTQLTMADIAFTFIEIDDILAARGLAPPWWISNVANILSFSILDPLNFEVLLDVKTMFAVGWIGGNRILPKHIWKPIVTGAIAPKSGAPWDPNTFAPDPNLIGSGPFRLDEYVEYSHLLLQTNRPGSVVDTGINTDPNANSAPITSPMGYFRRPPLYLDTHTGSYRSKINCIESVPPCNPQKWMWVDFTINVEGLESLEATRYVYVDGNPIADPWSFNTTIDSWYTENYSVNLTKCFHWIKVALWISGLTESPVEGFNTWVNTSIPIWVTIKEDIVGSYYVNTQLLAPDCKVDLKDVFAAGKAFGSVPGDAKWNTVADINNDYKIDLKDYFAIAKKFGKW